MLVCNGLGGILRAVAPRVCVKTNFVFIFSLLKITICATKSVLPNIPFKWFRSQEGIAKGFAMSNCGLSQRLSVLESCNLAYS